MTNAVAQISGTLVPESATWYSFFNEQYFEETNLTAEQGIIVVLTSSIYELNGLEVEAEIATVNAQVNQSQLLTGQELTSEIEEITAESSAAIALSGIERISELGTVIARATGETQMVPSKISYKKPRKNAAVTIIGVDLSSELGETLASGTIIINNVAKIHSIEARLEAKAVEAEGVLNLTDDEIILLMAA